MSGRGTLSRPRLKDACGTPPVATVSSRGNQRLAPAVRGSIALGAGSAASFFVGLALVPLTIGYLGSARFGAWMTVAAAAALLEPLDLGLGSALVTLLAKATGKGDASRGAQFFRVALGSFDGERRIGVDRLHMDAFLGAAFVVIGEVARQCVLVGIEVRPGLEAVFGRQRVFVDHL